MTWPRVPWLRKDASGRPPLVVQLLIIGAFLGFYDYIRDLTGRETSAVSNAQGLLRFERDLHIDVELSINRWLHGHTSVGYVAGTLYDSLHYLITFPLLLAVYIWWPRAYRRLRDVLLVVNLVGLVVFWLVPMAPPRLTSGAYHDIVAETGALGGTAAAAQKQVDQYAAMPSLHVGWALWVTVAIFAITTRRAWRIAAVAYPVLTVVVIVSTGNHWLLDAVAGSVCLALSVLLVDVVLSKAHRRAPDTLEEAPVPVG